MSQTNQENPNVTVWSHCSSALPCDVFTLLLQSSGGNLPYILKQTKEAKGYSKYKSMSKCLVDVERK